MEIQVASFTPLLQQTVDSLSRMIGAWQSFVYLAGPEQDEFLPLLAQGQVSPEQERYFFSHPLAPDADVMLYEMISGELPLVAYNAHAKHNVVTSIFSGLHLHRAIALPIRIDGQVIGLYLAGKPDGQEDFSAADVELASFATNTLALTLENARLYQESQLRLQESQSLNQVALALLQRFNLKETLEIICTAAQRLTHAQGSSVSLLEEPHWLRVAFHVGETPFAEGRFAVNGSLLGLAITRDDPLLINQQKPTASRDGADGHEPGQSPAPGEPLSLLAVPLRVKGEVIGVLDVVNKRGGFTPNDVRLIHLFASQAAIAIDQARLYQEARRAASLEERQRLARDLHDSVNQHLYGINLYTQAAIRHLESGNASAAASHLRNIQASAKDALSEMRLLIFELRPPVLESEGLVAALEARLKSVEERTGLKTGLKVRLPGRLPPNVEDELYRIAQEALNNVRKHAQATKVNLHLILSGRALLMRIEDNGVGFEVPQAETTGKIGLRTMQERVNELGGTLTITSQPGQGTTILVEVSI